MGFEVALKKYALLRIFLAVTEDFLQPIVYVCVIALQKGKKKCPPPQPQDYQLNHIGQLIVFFYCFKSKKVI